MSKVIRVLLVAMGGIFVVLGIAGIFLPLLPTTPFLLLGASCFVKGSDKMYNWLINNRFLGEYIRNYREKKGIPLKTKILAISMLWSTILFSIVFVIGSIYIKAMLLIIASAVTCHILMQKTFVKDLEQVNEIEDIEAENANEI